MRGCWASTETLPPSCAHGVAGGEICLCSQVSVGEGWIGWQDAVGLLRGVVRCMPSGEVRSCCHRLEGRNKGTFHNRGQDGCRTSC